MPQHIYTEDHLAFRDSVRAFIDRSVRPRAQEMIDGHAIPRDLWLEAGRQGLFGLCIPEEFGGAGVDDYRFNAVSAQEKARFTQAPASCFGIHSDVCPPYLVALGTQEQKQRWLPGIAAGETIIGIGMTEPSGGSDLAALKTTAKKDGDHYVLNGRLVGAVRKPLGWLTPLPLMKAAPSARANSIAISSASQVSRSNAASSSMDWLAAGLA